MPHLTTLWKAIVLSFIINYFIVSADVESTTVGDSVAMETSYEDDDLIPSYILPKHIFNEGKPFYVDKDPISGKLDFSSKKSAGLENFIANVQDANKEKATDIHHPPGLNEITPNFHDFLNLPVKYSSAKSVYPLVSSSYANLKYQGNNKNYVSNHKNYTTSTTSSPKYYTSSQKQSTTTKLFSSTKPFTSTIRSTERPSTSSATMTTASSTTPLTTSTPRSTTTTEPTEPTTAFRRRPSLSTTSSTTPSIPPTRRTYPSPTTPIYQTRPQTRPTRGPSKYEYTPKPLFEDLQRTTEVKKSTVELHRSTSPAPPTTTTQVKVTTTSHAPSPSSPATIPVRFPSSAEISQSSDKKTMTLADLFSSFSDDEAEETDEIATDSNAIQLESSSERINDQSTGHIKNSGGAQFHHDDYVKYEVQRPNLNVMPYQPVSSMNNIVISPNQNSASFVLGSQQSVGESGGGVFVGSAEQAPIFENQSHQGSSLRPHGFTTMPSIQIKPHEYKSTSVRFPNAADQQMEAFENAPVITGTYNNEITIPNGHSAPVALPHHQIVVFPPNEKLPVATVNAELGSNFDSKQVGTRIVFGSDEPIQKPKENDFQKPPPTLPDSLTPPLEGLPIHQRPNAIPNNQYMGFNRPHPPPHFFYGPEGNHRKPIPPIHRPMLDRPLPNILPQFRPNAKVSHGHPYNKEVGVQRVSPINGPNRRPQDIHHPVPPPPPSFPIRRTPLPHHFTSKIAAGVRPIDFNHSEPNRRIYRLPPPRMPQGPIPGPDRLYAQSLPPRKFIDGFPVAQHPNHPDGGPPPRSGMPPPPYDNENFFKQPPRSKLMERNDQERPKLEPVVTLQMMQTKKILQGPGNSQAQNVTAAINVGSQQGVKLGGGEKSPVYVVYPMKSGSDTEDPIVIGQRGDQLPLPPSEISSLSHNGGEYQNTPFTIIHHDQEPILGTRYKSKPPKSNFPYFMEQPDPKTAGDVKKVPLTLHKVSEDHQHSLYNIGEEPMGPPVEQKISSTLTRVTERPIAIAYTPTEPNNFHRRPDDRYSMPNYGHAVISEIRDTQTEASFMRDESEYPVRDEHYEQDFQAPFFPSINLGTVTDPYRGPVPIPDSNNKIDRADVDISEAELNSAELVTRKFDLEAFQPEYLSGFKPIYPSDTTHQSQKAPSVPSIPSSGELREASTTEETRTEQPIKSEMSSFEETLDALFGSMDDEEEDGEAFDDVDTTTMSKR